MQAKNMYKKLQENCKEKKLADKPGSVVDSHSSRRTIAHALQQPTR